LYFVDYDEALISEHKGVPITDLAKPYGSVDAMLAYLRDHFILLNPELYILKPEAIAAAA